MQGQTLAATAGAWTGGPSAYAYEWRRCDAAGAGCAAIGAAVAASYALVAADVGHTLRVAVTASNAAGSATAVSAQTAVVEASSAEASFGQATVASSWDQGGAGYLDVTGPYAVSQPVSVSRLSGYMAGGSAVSRMRGLIYADSGGQPGPLMGVTSEISLAAGAAANWVSLPFASALSLPAGSYWLGYWYADANAHRYYVNRSGWERYRAFAYSATGSPAASFGSATSAYSNYSLVAVYATAAPSPPANTVPPAITGTPAQGQTLSASTGTWSGNPTSYTYQWRRCNTAGDNCTTILAANGQTYTLTIADLDTTIRVAVTATNTAGNTTAVSTQTAVVTQSAPPANTVLPAISGSAVQGQTLAATAGAWTGGPSAYAYEWRRCDAAGAGCAAIGAAVAASYALVAADVGHTLRVAVTASNAAGSATAVSAQTAVVEASSAEASFGQATVASSWDQGGAGYLDVTGPYAVSQPVSVSRLSGYMAGGSAVSRMRGLIYADSGGQPGPLMGVTSEISLAAGAAANWVSLPFASALSLPAGSYWLGYWYADANAHRYYVNRSGWERYRAFAYSATGSPAASFGSATSAYSNYSLVAVYATAAPSPPANTVPPAITGTPAQGQTLSASTGTWSGNPTSYTYQWRRCNTAGDNCTTILAANGQTYTLTIADLDTTIRVAVTATNTAGNTTAVSTQTAVVTGAPTEASFGQAQAGTQADGGSAGYLDMSGPYTLGSAVSVTRLSGYMAGGSAVSRMRGVIYANSGGQPGALMAVSSEVSVAAGAAATWVSLPFASPVALPAGSYWLGYWYADGNGRRYYIDTTGAERYKAAAYSATGNPPTSFGTGSTSTSSYSLVAVYRVP